MDGIDPLRVVFAFLLVLGLIGLLALGLKRYNKLQVQGRGEEGRLKVLETRWLDSKRRLVLVKRDEKEHLLLLADGRETVIESGIEGKKNAL